MYRCSRGVFHLVFSGTPLSYLTKHVARYVYTGTVRDVRYMAPHGCQTGTTPSRGMAHPLHTVIIGGPRHDEVDLVDVSLLCLSPGVPAAFSTWSFPRPREEQTCLCVYGTLEGKTWYKLWHRRRHMASGRRAVQITLDSRNSLS